jgi:hypothetical protein
MAVPTLCGLHRYCYRYCALYNIANIQVEAAASRGLQKALELLAAGAERLFSARKAKVVCHITIHIVTLLC